MSGSARPQQRLRVLVAGREGQLARALLPAFGGAGWEVAARGRDSLDLAASAGAIGEAVRADAPDLVVNAAAYTAVDRAESELDAAMAVNRDGAAALAQAAASVGAPVLHVSTDYVFNGDKGEPYAEDDAPAPIGAYGRSKLEGEAAVLAANPRSLVLRTSWVCSATGQNFLRTMLRLAETRDEVSVVDDQRGAPTFAADLAGAIARMAPRLVASPAGDSGLRRVPPQRRAGHHLARIRRGDLRRRRRARPPRTRAARHPHLRLPDADAPAGRLAARLFAHRRRACHPPPGLASGAGAVPGRTARRRSRRYDAGGKGGGLIH